MAKTTPKTTRDQKQKLVDKIAERVSDNVREYIEERREDDVFDALQENPPEDSSGLFEDESASLQADATLLRLAEVMTSSVGGIAKVTVSVKDVRAAEGFAYLDEFPAEGFSLNFLRDEYGPGTYRIKFIDSLGNPITQRRELFTVAALKKDNHKDQGSAPVSETKAILEAVTSQFNAMVERMDKQAQMQTTMMLAMMQNKPNDNGFSSRDLIELMKVNMTASAVNAPPAPTLEGMVDTMLKLQTMTQPQQQQNPMDLVLKGMELAGKLQGGGGGESETNSNAVFVELIRQFGPAVNTLISQNPPAPHGGQPRQIPQPPTKLQKLQQIQGVETAPVQERPQPSTLSEQEAIEVDNFLKIIGPELNTLHTLAMTRMSPATVATLVLDKVSDDHLGDFYDFLQRPDWFQALCKLDGRLAGYAKWFDDVRLEILESLTPEEEEDIITAEVGEKVEDGMTGDPGKDQTNT